MQAQTYKLLDGRKDRQTEAMQKYRQKAFLIHWQDDIQRT